MITNSQNKEVTVYTYLSRPVTLVSMRSDGSCIIENEQKKYIKVNKDELKQEVIQKTN